MQMKLHQGRKKVSLLRLSNIHILFIKGVTVLKENVYLQQPSREHSSYSMQRFNNV